MSASSAVPQAAQQGMAAAASAAPAPWLEMLGTPMLVWSCVTVAVYYLTMTLYRKTRGHPFMLPVLTGTAIIIGLMLLTGTSYQDYIAAVTPLGFFLGPATVALAVPLFGQMSRIKTMWLPVTVALVAGAVAAMLSTVAIAWALGADWALLVSLMPKSATMPVATSLAEHFGGLTPLAASAVAITGIGGTMLARPLLAWMLKGNQDEDAIMGFTLGLSAHAVGTAGALQINATAGAFAAMAMSLTGLLTAVLMPALVLLMRWMGWGGA